MSKWKCTVCRDIMESEKKPKKCMHCDADSHKIKALFKLLKKRFDFMD